MSKQNLASCEVGTVSVMLFVTILLGICGLALMATTAHMFRSGGVWLYASTGAVLAVLVAVGIGAGVFVLSVLNGKTP